MPTVLRIGPFRFHFYSGDGGEPRHVHVERDDSEAKFWLDPVRLAANHGFSKGDLRVIRAHVVANQAEFRRRWDAFFNTP